MHRARSRRRAPWRCVAFPHVAGPGIRLEKRDRVVVDAADCAVGLPRWPARGNGERAARSPPGARGEVEPLIVIPLMRNTRSGRNSPSRTHGLEIAVCRGDDSNMDLNFARRSDAHPALRLQHARSAACATKGSSPISSSSSVPPSASSKAPLRKSVGARGAPRSCPNSVLSTSCPGKIAAQLRHTIRPRRRTLLVEGADYVPLSRRPSRRAGGRGIGDGATCSTCSNTAFMASLRATRLGGIGSHRPDCSPGSG